MILWHVDPNRSEKALRPTYLHGSFALHLDAYAKLREFNLILLVQVLSSSLGNLLSHGLRPFLHYVFVRKRKQQHVFIMYVFNTVCLHCNLVPKWETHVQCSDVYLSRLCTKRVQFPFHNTCSSSFQTCRIRALLHFYFSFAFACDSA